MQRRVPVLFQKQGVHLTPGWFPAKKHIRGEHSHPATVQHPVSKKHCERRGWAVGRKKDTMYLSGKVCIAH